MHMPLRFSDHWCWMPSGCSGEPASSSAAAWPRSLLPAALLSGPPAAAAEEEEATPGVLTLPLGLGHVMQLSRLKKSGSWNGWQIIWLLLL
jgi:hypothetical protein